MTVELFNWGLAGEVSVAFLTFPSATVLVGRIAWLYRLKASRTNKDPGAGFFSAYSIKRIARRSAAAAWFDPNPLYFDHRSQLLALGITPFGLSHGNGAWVCFLVPG